MSELVESYVSNGTVALHCVASAGTENKRVGVAVVPGLSETADDWRSLLTYLAPLPAAAITLRGRGSSSVPSIGYSLSHHSSDIAASVAHLPAAKVVLVAFSRSVGYALEYAINQPAKLSGLVLLDYPPRHSRLPKYWSDSFAESAWRGRQAGTVLQLSTLQAIERESEAKDFATRLSSIRVPTLIVQGGLNGAALSATDASVYISNLPHCTLVTLEHSSHALWKPEPSALYEPIARFTRHAVTKA